jgi:hypothetical protein
MLNAVVQEKLMASLEKACDEVAAMHGLSVQDVLGGLVMFGDLYRRRPASKSCTAAAALRQAHLNAVKR